MGVDAYVAVCRLGLLGTVLMVACDCDFAYACLRIVLWPWLLVLVIVLVACDWV